MTVARSCSTRVVGLLSCCVFGITAATVAGQPGAPSPAGEIREIEIVAGRYSFAPDTIEVAEGERVRLVVRSVDVTHGLAIESLGVDVEIPADGETVTIDLDTPPAGAYDFTCSVFCGVGHGRMAGTLTVRPADGTAPGATVSESDFTVITLATTKRLPPRKSAFRLTHRFTRPFRLKFSER